MGERLVREAEVDEQTRQKAAFYVKQIGNAIAPSNFVLTNPELLRETLAAKGENLVRGMQMLAEDIQAGHGNLKIRQSDPGVFEVGRNLALTPGKVVFQNELIQLLQYEATTPEVLKVPLLIVPPWINKFYILDLTPEKSFIKWCVDNGITVFVVSWVNPDAKLAEKSFEQYMREGVMTALDAVEAATGESQVHTIGYCVGGTLLAITLAYLAAKQDNRVLSATLFAAQVDFTYAGDLMVFVDKDRIAQLEEHMREQGYLEASSMATAFNLLRSNDLIWPYVINNYMRGKNPLAFDILFWNSDATRMPAANHSFYLRNCYLDNNLSQEKDGDRWRHARSQEREDADLQSRHPRGPHRAGKIGAVRFAILRRPGEIRAGRIRPYRRRDQPARQAEIPVLDRQEAERFRRRPLATTATQEHPGSWWPDWLRLAQGPGRRDRAGARDRQRQAQGHRGRAGVLCESEKLDLMPMPSAAAP